jgi:pimeloyl-ACP methyl ester carboxylesterase
VIHSNWNWRTVLALSALLPVAALAQDLHPGDPGYTAPAAPYPQTASHFGSAPVDPPETNDQTFVVDQDGGLDTGCTFRSGGPLIFTIKIDRYVGDKAKLIANDLIGETAALSMPAYDVDFDAVIEGINPERDRVSFNGHVVPGEFLTGSNNIWLQNDFEVPIDWVNFPTAPGSGGGRPTAADNVIRIDIDVANSGEYWCTAIDWASLTIKVARPVVMAHGIFSEGGVWGPIWVNNLDALGLPNSNSLNMGALDGIGANAAKIAAEVAKRKEEWGVDKVVLVGHSKGGLDGRDFVESSPDVEQLVQIGTPNLGSPLADKVQGALLRAGLLPAVIVNGLVAAFAGPAGLQLTTPYMAGYNLFHGPNRDVRYTALAGDYDPDCFFLNPFCRPVQRILLALSGSPGDTIVPVSSVHSLSYTANRTFASSGGNMDATHACLPTFSSCELSSQAIFDNLSDRVRAFGTAAPGFGGPVLPPFVATATVVGSIQQGQTVELPLPIDEQTEVFFSLLYPSGDLDLVLVSPSGQVIDPSVADADAAMSHDDGGLFGGLLEVYDLGQPEVGVWTMRVSAPSVIDPSGEVGFLVNGWLEDPSITLSGKVAEPHVRAGDPLRLEAMVLESGAPLTGATATATVGRPDGTTHDVSLLDDGVEPDDTAGDGVYTGTFNDTVQAGDYPVVFVAERTGSAAGPDFSREVFALATASRSGSTFTGTFRDSGVDTDGDGFFNQLRLEADLDVTDAADYRIFAVLEDANGNTHEANVVTTLAPGPATVQLNFDGEAIFQNGVDGPYTLSVIRLAEESGLALMPVDELTAAYQTAAYSFTDFQHAPILLTGVGSSSGRDVNGNGLFDFLDVRVQVRVDVTTYYQWSARLTDVDGTDLGFFASYGFFTSGLNDLTFSFPGEPIGANAVDGPYFVSSLIVFGAGDSLVAQRAFATDAFLASQFEGFSGDTTPPTLEVALEPDLLWPPNHRLVEVTADILVSDDTDPAPAVTLVSIVSDEPDDGLGDGDTAGDIQGADYGTDDREFLLRAERDGLADGRVYTVTYRAVDDSGNSTETVVEVTVPHDRGN